MWSFKKNCYRQVLTLKLSLKKRYFKDITDIPKWGFCEGKMHLQQGKKKVICMHEVLGLFSITN